MILVTPVEIVKLKFGLRSAMEGEMGRGQFWVGGNFLGCVIKAFSYVTFTAGGQSMG